MKRRRGPTRPLPERRAQPAQPASRATMVLTDRHGAILVTTRDSVRQALLVDGLRGSLLEAANRQARLAQLDRLVAATQAPATTAELMQAAGRVSMAPGPDELEHQVVVAALAHERRALPLYRDHGDPT